MKNVFVIGAGAAGLFASQQLAQAGHRVFLFNRDIKPGGLAEYGIYPQKLAVKSAWRKQFEKILDTPSVSYYGHVKIGVNYDVTLDELWSLGADAILCTCGAQGYHRLGIAGEDLRGVYSAKDFVYHYNQLPPYASMDFSIGRKIAVVGIGNVAADIVRWLLEDGRSPQTEEVTILARRGPLEAKIDEEEIEYVQNHIDRRLFHEELARVRERCTTCKQDVSPGHLAEATFPFLATEPTAQTAPILRFRFLTSLQKILPNGHGGVRGVVVTENDLVLRGDGNTSARETDRTSTLDADTVIFAIGDSQDPGFGLPMASGSYASAPNLESPSDPAYEAWDPGANTVLKGTYLAGWARRASTGLVGVAKKDGKKAAERIVAYLETLPEKAAIESKDVETFLAEKGIPFVTKSDLHWLAKAEKQEASTRNLEYFKYSSDAAMFQAIAEESAQERTTAETLVP